jgi:phenylpropionate dioxygenase-like ring-hydroxylating dioxygenase large terminal subunit
MFINFWYAAVLSKDLGAEPMKVKMLDRNFVLFRDSEGRAHCLSNVCVHRCASLANGWIEGDNVVCPYHGWQYAGDGRCQRIPSLGPDQPQAPPRARVDSYPTEERYGLVFAFLGDLPEEQRPPILSVNEWDNPDWRITTQTLTIKANYLRLVENALDLSHPEFVHFVGHKGADPNYKMPDYEIEHGTWGDGARVRFPRQAKGLWKYVRDNETFSEAGTTYQGPNQLITRIHVDAKMKAYQYLYETPIDRYETRTFLVSARNFFRSPLLDRLSDKRNGMIVGEDRAIVEAIEPAIAMGGRTNDLSVKADAIQIAFRERVADWERLGWRIDSEQLERDQTTTAHVIPSPDRRDSKSWVFPTVPLMPTGPEQSKSALGA